MRPNRDTRAVTRPRHHERVIKPPPLSLPPCPRCGASSPLRILYGYPTPEAFEAAERGELAIGGCMIGRESPRFVCGACRAQLPWVAPDE